MANFSQTITNSVRCFGGGPTTKWGQSNYPYTMTWGTAKWGEGLLTTDTINSFELNIIKVKSNSITPDTTISESLNAFRTISNEITPSSDMTDEQLYDGTLSWNYVFGNSTNAENTSSPTWGLSASGSNSFTSGTGTSTSWSSL